MSSPDTNLLLVAALGAGGLWLFHDREKHRRAAEDATTALAMVEAGATRLGCSASRAILEGC